MLLHCGLLIGQKDRVCTGTFMDLHISRCLHCVCFCYFMNRLISNENNYLHSYHQPFLLSVCKVGGCVFLSVCVWVCAACKKWKRDSFQAWPCGIGLSGWYSASCFCWENTRGIFGWLLISSESRTGRQENTHFQAFVKWFPYANTHRHTHAHTRYTHTRRAPSIHPRLSLPGCLHPAAQLEMTHTRAHAHTLVQTCTSSYTHSRVIHASFQITVLIKCSHMEQKLNKPQCPNQAVGRFFRSDPRGRLSSSNTIVVYHRNV